MESRNPVLTRDDLFTRGGVPSAEELQAMYDRPRAMTLEDVVARTGVLLTVIIATGAVAWIMRLGWEVALMAALVGLGLALVVTFKRVTSPGLILAYAATEGVFLGAVSRAFDAAYPGIVIQAATGTALTFAGMLWAYRSRRIRVTPRFTRVVVGATIGILLLAVVNLVASLFVSGGLGLRSGGPVAVLFSLAAIVVAALFLILDFDQVERAIEARAPVQESWLASFGLIVTLVWLYLEILRLLSYLRGDE